MAKADRPSEPSSASSIIPNQWIELLGRRSSTATPRSRSQEEATRVLSVPGMHGFPKEEVRDLTLKLATWILCRAADCNRTSFTISISKCRSLQKCILATMEAQDTCAPEQWPCLEVTDRDSHIPASVCIFLPCHTEGELCSLAPPLFNLIIKHKRERPHI